MSKITSCCSFLCVLFLLAHINLTASPVPDTVYNPYTEISKIIARVTDTARQVKFNTAYYYKNVDTSATTRDTITGVYYQHGNAISATMGNLLVIQDQFYNLSIQTDDSIIIVSRPKDVFTSLLQKNILSDEFQSQYLDSIQVVDSGSTRKLSFKFNSKAPYRQYDLLYNPALYDPLQIVYQLRHIMPLPDIEGNYPADLYYTEIKMVFSNYTYYNPDIPYLFYLPTNLFVAQVTGGYAGIGIYSDYTVYNQTNQN